MVVSLLTLYLELYLAFSALTMLVGWQEGHPAVKNWVLGCWHGCVSGTRCRFSCNCVWGKVHICIWPRWCHCYSLSLAPINADWYVYLPGYTFLVPAHPGIPWQNPKGHKMVVIVVVIVSSRLMSHIHPIVFKTFYMLPFIPIHLHCTHFCQVAHCWILTNTFTTATTWPS